MRIRTPTKTGAGSGGKREFATIFLHAVAIAFVVRVFFYQPFNIPSGSMQSTLLIGDYLFVSKLSYGYSRWSFPSLPFGIRLNLVNFPGRVFASEPKRGDVAVFKLPRDTDLDYIKRVVGLPGDRIQMREGVLQINGAAVPKRYVDDFVQIVDENGRTRRTRRFEETLPEGRKYMVLDSGPTSLDNTREFVVPAGHYFMMGDNRDNSTDSRVPREEDGVGFVPFENLVGRADIIFHSFARMSRARRCSSRGAGRWTSAGPVLDAL
jgi:signal peptidase I